MVSSRASFGIAVLLSVGLWVGDLEAKTVRYQIYGQSFSYSTSNRQQVVVACERLRAAKAAAAARAKAQAEAAANPLVGLFGSQAQTEANSGEAHLQKVLARSPITSESSRKKKAGPVVIARKSAKKASDTSAIPKRLRVKKAGTPTVAVRKSTNRLWEEFLRWRSRQSQDRQKWELSGEVGQSAP